MRAGLVTYAALGLFVLLAPVLLGSVFLAPGLVGVLAFLGLGGLAAVASLTFTVAIAVMLVLAAIEARGTYHVREHVRDMAPWAVTFVGIAAVVGAVR